MAKRKVTITVEFGFSVENKDRCSIEKGEVLSMLRLTVFIGEKADETKLGQFLIKELVVKQEETKTFFKTKVVLNCFSQKFNKLLNGCIFPVLREYNMKEIDLELVDADDLDNKLSLLYDALKIAGVKDYKEKFDRNGFYTLEDIKTQTWNFDKKTFKNSLNLKTITIS